MDQADVKRVESKGRRAGWKQNLAAVVGVTEGLEAVNNLVIEVDELNFKRARLGNTQVILTFTGHRGFNANGGFVKPRQDGVHVCGVHIATRVDVHRRVLNVLRGDHAVFGQLGDDRVGA